MRLYDFAMSIVGNMTLSTLVDGGYDPTVNELVDHVDAARPVKQVPVQLVRPQVLVELATDEMARYSERVPEKIPMIALVRVCFAFSLKEAKDLVDNLTDKYCNAGQVDAVHAARILADSRHFGFKIRVTEV